MDKRMPEESSKNVKKEQQQHHRQGEPLGQKHEGTGEDQKKRTIQFDKGQKFTSDEDILKRRTA
jgi:hypothetical protein